MEEEENTQEVWKQKEGAHCTWVIKSKIQYRPRLVYIMSAQRP